MSTYTFNDLHELATSYKMDPEDAQATVFSFHYSPDYRTTIAIAKGIMLKLYIPIYRIIIDHVKEELSIEADISYKRFCRKALEDKSYEELVEINKPKWQPDFGDDNKDSDSE